MQQPSNSDLFIDIDLLIMSGQLDMIQHQCHESLQYSLFNQKLKSQSSHELGPKYCNNRPEKLVTNKEDSLRSIRNSLSTPTFKIRI